MSTCCTLSCDNDLLSTLYIDSLVYQSVSIISFQNLSLFNLLDKVSKFTHGGDTVFYVNLRVSLYRIPFCNQKITGTSLQSQSYLFHI